MKNISLALLLGLAIWGTGCATYQTADVTTYYDNVSGLRTDLLSDNLLEAGENPRELLYLNASRVFHSGSRYSYYLEVSYMAREEVGVLGIPPGDSLTLQVDDEKLVFSGTGSQDDNPKPKDGVIQETAIYRVDKLTLQKISIAQSVKVAVSGQKGLVEREFTEENKDKFRRFVTRYAL